VHPILANRSRSVLYVASWLPIAALLIGVVTRRGAMSFLDAAAFLVPMCFIYAFICQASWYLCVAVPFRESDILRLCATQATAAAVSAGIWIGLGGLWTWALDSSGYLEGIELRYISQLPILFLSGVLLFLLAVALNYLLITLEASQVAERKTLVLQVLAREAELRALRAQIDPHFLFNSLNSINALVTVDPAAARRMCVLLADFLRGSLKLGSEDHIPLSEEIRLAECYLDIERVRLGSRLRVDREIGRDCESCMVPPLIMQPIIENAVKHGVAPMLDGGTVHVRAERNGAGVKIVVENPYEADVPSKTGAGLGLKNVRLRLANVYDGDARLDVDDKEGRFRVELQLPCQQE
jgi:two-component system sensor histidine kinase AlgZ